MQNLNEIEDLIKLISKLPGLGPKSAKRIVLKLINNKDEPKRHVKTTHPFQRKNAERCYSLYRKLFGDNVGSVKDEYIILTYFKTLNFDVSFI